MEAEELRYMLQGTNTGSTENDNGVNSDSGDATLFMLYGRT